MAGAKTYLGSDQGKARRHRSFEYAEEQTNRNCSREVLDAGEAAQDQAPDQNTRGRVFAQRQPLQQAVGWVLPRQISCALIVSYTFI